VSSCSLLTEIRRVSNDSRSANNSAVLRSSRSVCAGGRARRLRPCQIGMLGPSLLLLGMQALDGRFAAAGLSVAVLCRKRYWRWHESSQGRLLGLGLVRDGFWWRVRRSSARSLRSAFVIRGRAPAPARLFGRVRFRDRGA